MSESNASKIASLSLDEKLLLMEYLAMDVCEKLPESIIAPQVLYNIQYLRGTAEQKGKLHRHDKGIK